MFRCYTRPCISPDAKEIAAADPMHTSGGIVITGVRPWLINEGYDHREVLQLGPPDTRSFLDCFSD